MWSRLLPDQASPHAGLFTTDRFAAALLRRKKFLP